MWCSLISITLYAQIKYGKVFLNMHHMQAVVWGLSLIMMLAPLGFGLVYGGCAGKF